MNLGETYLKSTYKVRDKLVARSRGIDVDFGQN